MGINERRNQLLNEIITDRDYRGMERGRDSKTEATRKETERDESNQMNKMLSLKHFQPAMFQNLRSFQRLNSNSLREKASYF